MSFLFGKPAELGVILIFGGCNPLDSQPSSHLCGDFCSNQRGTWYHLVSNIAPQSHKALEETSQHPNEALQRFGWTSSSWTDPTHHAKAGPPDFFANVTPKGLPVNYRTNKKKTSATSYKIIQKQGPQKKTSQQNPPQKKNNNINCEKIPPIIVEFFLVSESLKT